MEVFDEDKATQYILDRLGKEAKVSKKYTADDILEIIDIIWDYYEDNGFLDLNISLDENDDSEADKGVLVAHVVKMIKKDRSSAIEIDDVPYIVDAELCYENLCDEL